MCPDVEFSPLLEFLLTEVLSTEVTRVAGENQHLNSVSFATRVPAPNHWEGGHGLREVPVPGLQVLTGA